MGGHGIAFVYFDLGKVLVDFDPRIGCRNVADLLGVTPLQAHAAIYDSGLQHRFEHGDVTGPEFADQVCRALGRTDVSAQALLEAASDMFWPIESMRGVMQRVRDCGFGVGLLSNTCQAHWDWIQNRNYDVMKFEFDATVLSFQVGAMKPEPAIYEHAQSVSGMTAPQILFVDDRDENVAAAKICRWHAVCCTGGEAAIGTLNAFGVLAN